MKFEGRQSVSGHGDVIGPNPKGRSREILGADSGSVLHFTIRRTIVFLSIFASAFLQSVSAPAQEIVVSIPPQQEIVKMLCATDAELLIGPGQSPETWSPSPATMVRIVSSELYIPIGLPFENSLRKKLKEIAPELRICTGAIPSQSDGTLDPHRWLDPESAIEHARAVARCLKALPEKDARKVDAGLASFEATIRAREEKAAEILKPYRDRTFLVYHPAFGHFARRFQLHQLAIEKDGKAPSPRWMTEVIDRARQLHIRTIFVQPEFASDAVGAIARSLNAEIVELDPLAADLSENILRIAEKIADSFGQEAGNGKAPE